MGNRLPTISRVTTGSPDSKGNLTDITFLILLVSFGPRDSSHLSFAWAVQASLCLPHQCSDISDVLGNQSTKSTPQMQIGPSSYSTFKEINRLSYALLKSSLRSHPLLSGQDNVEREINCHLLCIDTFPSEQLEVCLRYFTDQDYVLRPLPNPSPAGGAESL